ncbi:rhoptry associated membrane antigen, putative [Perkinsus marinus ATCC 50983]|uniref:Rhoptry associated membrane antigen, putative n=1 Tax=Perkinsus marinus (strain ATCC 50983 / TXsc) TaxID=423536 RepID=C5LV95_PERM5|nr:rhoptry associated membrane antigen, putative [Perkinsus marinus ATCC 50983]EEQ99333.1 rhoptry associated membrane antigen, putative [Perkinsus marinus ATCC 50983]|eukprot:XP_002766616.1 rhoptry associated membrane antigen, putative [Perkinsus marinus ATCC 50983]
MPGAVPTPTGPMLTSEANPVDSVPIEKEKEKEEEVAFVTSDVPLVAEVDIKDPIREEIAENVVVKAAAETIAASADREVVQEETAIPKEHATGPDSTAVEASESQCDSVASVDGSYEDSQQLVGGENKVPSMPDDDTNHENAVASEEKDTSAALEQREMEKPVENYGADQEAVDSQSEKKEKSDGGMDEEVVADMGLPNGTIDELKSPSEGEESEGTGAPRDDDESHDAIVVDEQELVDEKEENNDGEEQAQEEYEVWTGEEAPADEEDEGEFLTLEEVKEAVVKVTQQLEEDDENIDLKVLEEFTEEYERMSETQINLQQKLTKVLAETNALWQEFEKYRSQYAQVMWKERREEREKEQQQQQSDEQWDWKRSNDGGNQSWSQNGNWKASDDGHYQQQQQQESWKHNDKSWPKDEGEGEAQQAGGWKKGGDKWSASEDNGGKQWRGGWKKDEEEEWPAEEESSRAEGEEKWKGSRNDKAGASWRDAEGGTGDSAEWQPKSGGGRGYDKKKWGDESKGEGKNWKWSSDQREDERGDWKQQEKWDQEETKAAEDAPPTEELPSVEADAAEDGAPKGSYSDLQAEVLRLRKMVAENEKSKAESVAAPPPPSPVPSPAAPPVAVLPVAPPVVPQQDGRAMEELAQKVGKDIEDRLQSKHREELVEMERRYLHEMQTQMRYMMQHQQQQMSSSMMPPPRDYAKGPRPGYQPHLQGDYDNYDHNGVSYSHHDDRFRRERAPSPYGSVSGMSGYAGRTPTEYRDYRQSPSAAQVSTEGAPPRRETRSGHERKLSPRDAKPRRPHQPPNVDYTSSKAVLEPRALRPTDSYATSTAAPTAPVGLPAPPRPSRSSAPLAEEALSVDNAMQAFRQDGARGSY